MADTAVMEPIGIANLPNQKYVSDCFYYVLFVERQTALASN